MPPRSKLRTNPREPPPSPPARSAPPFPLTLCGSGGGAGYWSSVCAPERRSLPRGPPARFAPHGGGEPEGPRVVLPAAAAPPAPRSPLGQRCRSCGPEHSPRAVPSGTSPRSPPGQRCRSCAPLCPRASPPAPPLRRLAAPRGSGAGPVSRYTPEHPPSTQPLEPSSPRKPSGVTSSSAAPPAPQCTPQAVLAKPPLF